MTVDVHRTVPLLVLVLVAGCLGGTDPGTSRSVDGPPDAPWADGRGINETALADQHFDALRSAGSFTLSRRSTVAIDGDTSPGEPRPDWYRPPSETRTEVDLGAGRYRRRSVTAGHSRATKFVSPEETARRRKPCTSDACDWEYHYLERPEHDTVAAEVDRFRNQRVVETMVQVMDDWNYTYDGTTDRNGVTVYRYTAEWTFDRPVHPFTERPTGTGTLLVTGDGVVLRWEYRYAGPAEVVVDGERRTVDVTIRNVQTYSAVGDTTVERPGWVDTANERDPAPTTATAGT